MVGQLKQYLLLIRLHKPIGIFLLLWPALWALWLAGDGRPSLGNVIIFVTAVFLVRSAGCVFNDIADRHFDAHVARTRQRPIASGNVSVLEAFILASVLGLAAFALVLFTNPLTLKLTFVGVVLLLAYPLLKRVTHLPQVGLGLAFAWSVPMAFAAEQNALPLASWWLFAIVVLWPVVYDTMYAMADREDDLKIGVKSTAILFGQWDVPILVALQFVLLAMLVYLGQLFQLHNAYYICLLGVVGLFLYQFRLILDRDPQQCFAAFLNHNWVGLVVFIGIMLSYLQ